MADVKGVILNGAKYENQDTEARTLAGQAINQVETLENSVNSLETDVTNLGQSVVDVSATATEANATATEAKATAETAVSALAERQPFITDGYLISTIAAYGSITIEGENWEKLLGKPMLELKNGDKFIFSDVDQTNRYQGKCSQAIIGFNGTQMVCLSPFMPTTEWTLDNGIAQLRNQSTSEITRLIYAIPLQ